jgi:septal ring factor EnvC (AmiA/AmiB activator)
MTAEADFGVDRTKTRGRRSHCKACDRRRAKDFYAAHKDELYAQREAAREAARQAELEALVPEHRKRVAAARARYRQLEQGLDELRARADELAVRLDRLEDR